jgi:hypothetical protein
VELNAELPANRLVRVRVNGLTAEGTLEAKIVNEATESVTTGSSFSWSAVAV